MFSLFYRKTCLRLHTNVVVYSSNFFLFLVCVLYLSAFMSAFRALAVMRTHAQSFSFTIIYCGETFIHSIIFNSKPKEKILVSEFVPKFKVQYM